MAITGIELNEPMVPDPRSSAMVGDMMVTPNHSPVSGSSVPHGSVAFTNTLTDESNVISGLLPSGTGNSNQARGVVGYHGYAWVHLGNVNGVRRVSLSGVSTSTLSYQCVCADGSNMLGYNNGTFTRFDPHTLAVLSVFTISGVTITSRCMAQTANGLVAMHGTNVVIDPIAESVVGTITSVGNTHQAVNIGDNRVMFTANIGTVPIYIVSTATLLMLPLTPGGPFNSMNAAFHDAATDTIFMVGSDNMTLYAIGVSHPLDGADTFPTVRARRGGGASANGHFWIPTGEPIT